MTDYRILVTGSRTWDDRAAVNSALDALLAEHDTLTVVHGAAREGADKMAHDWALEKHHAVPARWAVTVEPHPADWRPDGVFDKSAGFKRNAEMVNAGADVALAFLMPCANKRCRIAIDHATHGTSHCVTLAEKAGIPVRRIMP